MTYFDIKLMEDDELVRNLLESWSLVEDCDVKAGSEWYKIAYAECQKLADANYLAVWQVAAIVAVLSPQTEWTKNLRIARECIAKGTAEGSNELQRSRCKLAKKAKCEQDLPRLGGFKVQTFYASIMAQGLGTEVCVDTHAMNVLFHCRLAENVKSTLFKSKAVYSLMQAAYRALSEMLEGQLAPQQVQAVLWTAERRLKISSKLDKRNNI
jgi:hypothetical protein